VVGWWGGGDAGGEGGREDLHWVVQSRVPLSHQERTLGDGGSKQSATCSVPYRHWSKLLGSSLPDPLAWYSQLAQLQAELRLADHIGGAAGCSARTAGVVASLGRQVGVAGGGVWVVLLSVVCCGV